MNDIEIDCMKTEEKSEKDRNAEVLHYEEALKEYLGDLHDENLTTWNIEYREGFGRCMIATRDIQPNELIFRDKPIVIGPRSSNYEKIFCVCCYKVSQKLVLCSQKCKFPVCIECSTSDNHKAECELIRSWKLKIENRYSKYLFRALTVIRTLLLSEKHKEIVNMMECHQNTTVQNLEIDKILNEFECLQSDSDVVQELKRNSSVLNTNAFEASILNSDEESISLRGLYPVAALMNHCCIPSIRYVYRRDKTMAVYAAKFIKKGDQIFNSYTKFLWGTQQRRVHLAYSKKFLCKCDRCTDPTEFRSYISAIKCIKCCVQPGNSSIMLPMHPLIISSHWKCEQCGFKLDHTRASHIQDIFSNQVINKILNEKMPSINNYLKTKLLTFVPETNQFVIEVKLQIILKMKQEKDYEMTLEDYQDVEKYCYDVLKIIENLGTGESFVKGLLFYELVTAKIKIFELTGQEIKNVSYILLQCFH
jgi:hypothetical protein